MKTIIKILLGLLILMACLYIYMDITYYYPEKSKIGEMEARLFKVVKKDALTGCYVLQEAINLSDTTYPILFGIRFQRHFMSFTHEHYEPFLESVDGDSGHVDTIKSFDWITPTHTAFNVGDLSDASAFHKFKTDWLLSKVCRVVLG